MDTLSGLTNAREVARETQRGESLTALKLHCKYALLKQLTRHYLNVNRVYVYVPRITLERNLNAVCNLTSYLFNITYDK